MSNAAKYLAEAQQKSKSKGSWFSSSNPKEEAGDLYAKAANAFKLDKKYKVEIFQMKHLFVTFTFNLCFEYREI